MLRKCLAVLVAIAGLSVAACGSGPNDPMPMPDDGMLVSGYTADTLVITR